MNIVNTNGEGNNWKSQLPHVFATISLAMAAIWFIADMKKDIELLKQYQLITQPNTDTAQDKYLAQSLEQVRDKLNRIDDKLDRIIEKSNDRPRK
jgi:hypothetical protein